MFKDVKKNGKALKYEEAVDGSMGNMTRQALDLAKKKASNMLAHAPQFVREAIANNSIKVMNQPIYGKIMNKQQELWDAGAFKGIINPKTGKQVTYQEAVDGKIGKMTEQALKNQFQEISQSVQNINDIRNQSNTSFLNNIQNFTAKGLNTTIKNYSQESPNLKNLNAVMYHKIKNGVNEPYYYVDKKNGTMYKLQGNKILDKFPIATGVNLNQDGWVTTIKDSKGNTIYDRTKYTSSTPAGIFTLGQRTQKYGQPAFHLRQADRDKSNDYSFIATAIHAPANEQRKKQFNSGNRFLTYGCIQLPDGKVVDITKNMNPGDSVYIEPAAKNNYLYIDNGNIKTHFDTTPSTVSGTTWGQKFTRNDVKYNTGY